MTDEETGEQILARAAGAYRSSLEPYASPTRPAGASAGLIVDQCALALARKWKLLRSDGTVKCIRDGCDGDGLPPSLECGTCRQRRTAERNR